MIQLKPCYIQIEDKKIMIGMVKIEIENRDDNSKKEIPVSIDDTFETSDTYYPKSDSKMFNI